MQPHTRSDILLVMVTAMAAAGWIFTKSALIYMPPLLFMCVRFFTAGAILTVLDWRELKRFRLQQWRLALLPALLFGLAMTFWVHGVATGSHLGEGGFITSLSVIFVPWFSWLFEGKKPTKQIVMALPMAMSGLIFLSLQHGLHVDFSQLYYLAAALLLSCSFIATSHSAKSIPPLALTSVQMFMVSLLTGVVALWGDERIAFELNDTPSYLIIWLSLSVLISTAGRFSLQTYAQSMVPAGQAAAIMILEPVWIALFAALWIGETMSVTQLSGCALIFSALIVQRWHWIKQLLNVKAWLR